MEDLIEFVYSKVTKTDLDIDAEMRTYLTEKFGKVPAEAILKGLPAALVNMDMSTRLGFGNIMPDDSGAWRKCFMVRQRRGLNRRSWPWRKTCRRCRDCTFICGQPFEIYRLGKRWG